MTDLKKKIDDLLVDYDNAEDLTLDETLGYLDEALQLLATVSESGVLNG